MKSKLTPPRIQIQSTESSSHLDSSPKPDGTWYQLSPGQCCKSVEGIKIGMFARLARPVCVKLQLRPRASQPDLAHPLHSNQPQLFPDLINCHQLCCNYSFATSASDRSSAGTSLATSLLLSTEMVTASGKSGLWRSNSV